MCPERSALVSSMEHDRIAVSSWSSLRDEAFSDVSSVATTVPPVGGVEQINNTIHLSNNTEFYAHKFLQNGVSSELASPIQSSLVITWWSGPTILDSAVHTAR